MKKAMIVMIAASVLLLTGCSQTAETDPSGAAGTTAAVTEAETTTEEPQIVEVTAEVDEDAFGAAYWEENERLIPVTYQGDLEYNGTVLKTMADVFAVSGDEPNVGSSGNQFICIIENEDICSRFIANMPAAVTQALFELDVFDDDYRQNELDLVKDLEIARIDDLKDGMPTQDALDQYIGCTVSELADAGFELNGWWVADTEGEFTFDRDLYEYTVSFNEPLSEETDYNDPEATDGLTVKSITYSALSYNVFNTDDLFEESSAE